MVMTPPVNRARMPPGGYEHGAFAARDRVTGRVWMMMASYDAHELSQIKLSMHPVLRSM
jgi:hypothetical protein